MRRRGTATAIGSCNPTFRSTAGAPGREDQPRPGCMRAKPTSSEDSIENGQVIKMAKTCPAIFTEMGASAPTIPGNIVKLRTSIAIIAIPTMITGFR